MTAPVPLADPARAARSRREYAYVLLAGAIGGGLVLLAVRQRWARAVFTPPKPLAPQVVSVAGSELVPLAGALGLAALAGLVAVIATRGVARRAAGVLIALFGVGAGVAGLTRVTAATVVATAAGKVASPQIAADSGAAGSTTSGSTGGSGPLVVAGAAGHAVLNGTPWRVAVLIGALLIVAVGVATVLRGPDWPVMSARYDAPEARGGHPSGKTNADSAARPLDAASLWESLSGGADPTERADQEPGDPERADREPPDPEPEAAAEPADGDPVGQREGKA